MSLKQEVEPLRAENTQLRRFLAAVQERLMTEAARIAEQAAQLNQRGDPPAFVKPNRQKATHIGRHVLDYCPECHSTILERDRTSALLAGRYVSCFSLKECFHA